MPSRQEYRRRAGMVPPAGSGSGEPPGPAQYAESHRAVTSLHLDERREGRRHRQLLRTAREQPGNQGIDDPPGEFDAEAALPELLHRLLRETAPRWHQDLRHQAQARREGQVVAEQESKGMGRDAAESPMVNQIAV